MYYSKFVFGYIKGTVDNHIKMPHFISLDETDFTWKECFAFHLNKENAKLFLTFLDETTQK